MNLTQARCRHAGEHHRASCSRDDREAVFMQESLLPLLKRHQGLKVVVEHVTTAETLDIVRARAGRVAGTITPHHLVLNRTSLFQGGLTLHALATWADVLRADAGADLSGEERREIERFLADPIGWSARHSGRAGLPPHGRIGRL